MYSSPNDQVEDGVPSKVSYFTHNVNNNRSRFNHVMNVVTNTETFPRHRDRATVLQPRVCPDYKRKVPTWTEVSMI